MAKWISPVARGRVAAALLVLAAAVPCRGADKSAAELLPASTLFYAEIDRPKEVIGLVLDHPLRKRLEQSPEYRKAFETPQFKEFEAVVKAVEQRSGVPWRRAIEVTAGGGLVVAVDARTQGLVVLSKSTDPTVTAQVRDALLSLAREDAQAKGNPDPVEVKEYRGLTAHKAGDSIFGTMGPWLLISNKQDLAKEVADVFLDGGKSLADFGEFKEARASVAKGTEKPTAWAYVRMEPIRLMNAGKAPFDKDARGDDPGVELLFGGLVAPLRNAPYATAALTLDRSRLKLAVSAPHDPKWVGAERSFFFAPGGEGGGAAKPLRPKGTVLSLSTYRDLSAWWQAGPDLVGEGAAAKMAQADSGLSAFLGGKSFGNDFLGALRPQIQFVVAQQDYSAAGVHAPTIRLPSFALVLRLKPNSTAANDVRKHLRVGFQSIVALANLDGASKGRPLLEMKTEHRGRCDIQYATFESADAATEDKPDDAKAPAKQGVAAGEKTGDANDKTKSPEMMKANADIHLNFSPALVMSPDHLILCSTRQVAEELADLASKEEPGKVQTIAENTLIEVSPRPVAQLLKDNREQLIAQNMLEKGHSREQAEKEIDLFVSLVNGVTEAGLRLVPTDKSITIELDVKTNMAE